VLEAFCKAAFDRDVERIDPRSARIWGWTILESKFPILDVVFEHASAAPLRLRLQCDNWDELPPSIALLDRAGNRLMQAPPDVGSVFNPGPHPTVGYPFVCMRGVREYHTHFSHVNDYWDNYRGQPGMDLGGIVQQLWRAWKKAVG
jgi:Predicted metal binding domain